MPFELAKQLQGKHLIPQPSDLRLNPPESYLFVQDGLIISCGVLYALCYFCYATRTYSDCYLSGTVLYLAGTMSYEIYYAIVTTSTTFERLCFFAWFLCDVAFAGVALRRAYPPGTRIPTLKKLALGVLAGIAFLHALCQIYPDERQQVTAFWTGIILQLPINWGHFSLLLKEQSTKGQSLEMWITRYVGCYTAYGVFIWRYLNVPQNWEYVGSRPSIAIMALTLLPDTLFPFIYFWVHGKEQEARKAKGD